MRIYNCTKNHHRSHEKKRIVKAHTVPLTKDLLHSAKLNRPRYQENPRQQKKELHFASKKLSLGKKHFDFCDSMDKEFLELARMAEKKQYLKLLSKGTALKRKFLC